MRVAALYDIHGNFPALEAVLAEVERFDEGDVVVLRLHVAPDDVGKVIGRQGRVVRALRTVVRSAAARGDRRLVLEIAD